MYKDNNGQLRVGRIVRHALLLVVALVFLIGAWGTVGAGERGIRLRFSAPVSVLGEGFYLKLPIIERVVTMDVKVQKDEAVATAASRDLQTVNSKVAVNFHPMPDRVLDIYRQVGLSYKERIIDPSVQESVKAITARFTAEELVVKREQVRDEIIVLLRDKLSANGLVVDAFNIVDFDFSKSFNDAIEAKVTAEQQALAAKNKLEQVKFEAEQRIAQAKAEAEAIRIQAQAITQQGGQDYVSLKAIEKWNGTLPTYLMGNSVPFVNIK